jgi:hypothetical protein
MRIGRGTLLVSLCLAAFDRGAAASRQETPAALSAAPGVVYVTPGLGAGAGRTFTLAYSDADGASDIEAAEVLIANGTELAAADACYVYASGNHFWLRDDPHGAWIGPVAGGGTGRLANSQCALFAAGSSMSAAGSRLTVVVTVTFTIAFAGPKTVFMNATDRAGLASGWAEAGTWRVAPLNPGLDVVMSSCADSALDAQYSIRIVNDPSGRESRRIMTPTCFPTHAYYAFPEGMFLDRRPLPAMGRTAGRFDVLMLFFDNELNRQKLLENAYIPSDIKAQIAAGRVREGLQALFATYYTPAAVMAGLRREAASAVEFRFTVEMTTLPRRQLEMSDDGGLGFAAYDAVVLIDDLGTVSGIGVRRWPWGRHVFHGRDAGYFLNIAPGAIFPGLFGNELLRRNVPTLLSEYLIGERTLVVEGTVTYDRTPIVNPRTGENIEPLIRAYEGKTSIGVYLAGYADVDGDGVVDCIDPDIAPTVDNVDADFIPDRFDPDLTVNHRPYSWMYAPRP